MVGRSPLSCLNLRCRCSIWSEVTTKRRQTRCLLATAETRKEIVPIFLSRNWSLTVILTSSTLQHWAQIPYSVAEQNVCPLSARPCEALQILPSFPYSPAYPVVNLSGFTAFKTPPVNVGHIHQLISAPTLTLSPPLQVATDYSGAFCDITAAQPMRRHRWQEGYHLATSKDCDRFDTGMVRNHLWHLVGARKSCRFLCSLLAN